MPPEHPLYADGLAFVKAIFEMIDEIKASTGHKVNADRALVTLWFTEYRHMIHLRLLKPSYENLGSIVFSAKPKKRHVEYKIIKPRLWRYLSSRRPNRAITLNSLFLLLPNPRVVFIDNILADLASCDG